MKKHKCKIFTAEENYFLRGKLDDDILYLKSTCESDGIEQIKCEDCGKKINNEIKVELC